VANNKFLELAVVLSAVDSSLSRVTGRALSGINNGYSQLANNQQRADEAMRNGLKMGGGAKVAIDALAELSKKYGNVQEAQQDLRVSMMRAGGVIDEDVYKKDMELAEKLSAKYAGTQMAYFFHCALFNVSMVVTYLTIPLLRALHARVCAERYRPVVPDLS